MLPDTSFLYINSQHATFCCNYVFAACREPKVSELVRQRVLPPLAPSRYIFRFLRECFISNTKNYWTKLCFFSCRKTPVHKLYSSGHSRNLQSDSPTKGPTVLSPLPQGFHQLYTHIEYECASQYYQHFGSSRRTCLKTGKWSGRHVSCSPGEGSRGPLTSWRVPAEVKPVKRH